ncbi:MAG: PilW family protein [Woeseiaceae bacterium]|nr:PilW family protein [Woeseiaceae bacterium]
MAYPTRTFTAWRRESGMTLIEVMVALAIGSFLIIGAVQIYAQSRQSYIINESIAKVQDTASFAMDAIESDLRLASNWGRMSRPLGIEGRSVLGDANPNNLPGIPADCGPEWVLNLALPVDGDNNAYNLPCPPSIAAQANSDHLVVRRATVAPVPFEAGRIQLQTTRVQGALFTDGTLPTGFTAADSSTHNLLVSSYYVANDSELIPGVPALRRIVLRMNGGVADIIDEEIAPGVENLQVQFGVDVNDDNTVDRYVNPDSGVYDPASAAYIPGAKVITARVWLVVRGIDIENGLVDDNTYTPGDVDLGQPADNFRRMQVSKTVLLRNARS